MRDSSPILKVKIFQFLLSFFIKFNSSFHWFAVALKLHTNVMLLGICCR